MLGWDVQGDYVRRPLAALTIAVLRRRLLREATLASPCDTDPRAVGFKRRVFLAIELLMGYAALVSLAGSFFTDLARRQHIADGRDSHAAIIFLVAMALTWLWSCCRFALPSGGHARRVLTAPAFFIGVMLGVVLSMVSINGLVAINPINSITAVVLMTSVSLGAGIIASRYTRNLFAPEHTLQQKSLLGASDEPRALAGTPKPVANARPLRLKSLLIDAFRPQELQDALVMRETTKRLARRLPEPSVSSEHFMTAVVEAIARQPELYGEFFAVLVEERPCRVDEINEIAGLFGLLSSNEERPLLGVAFDTNGRDADAMVSSFRSQLGRLLTLRAQPECDFQELALAATREKWQLVLLIGSADARMPGVAASAMLLQPTILENFLRGRTRQLLGIVFSTPDSNACAVVAAKHIQWSVGIRGLVAPDLCVRFATMFLSALSEGALVKDAFAQAISVVEAYSTNNVAMQFMLYHHDDNSIPTMRPMPYGDTEPRVDA